MPYALCAIFANARFPGDQFNHMKGSVTDIGQDIRDQLKAKSWAEIQSRYAFEDVLAGGIVVIMLMNLATKMSGIMREFIKNYGMSGSLKQAPEYRWMC